MRMLFSIVGLLVVVLAVSLLTKKQLAAVQPQIAPATSGTAAGTTAGATAGTTAAPAPAPTPNDVKQTVEGLLQAPRPGGDDAAQK